MTTKRATPPTDGLGAILEEMRREREDRARDHAAFIEEMRREREDRARDHAAFIEEMRREREAFREQMRRDTDELCKEIRRVTTQIQVRGAIFVSGGGLATITILRFLMDTPG